MAPRGAARLRWTALLGAALWGSVSGSAKAEAPPAEPLRLEAEEILWDDGLLRATGDVRLSLPGATVRAAGLTWSDAGLTLEAPSLQVGGFAVDAAALRWSPESQALTLEQGRLNPCGACPPAWSVEAQTLRWSLDAERGQLQRAVLRVGPVPVLWLPRVPLRAEPWRVQPGLPALGRGPDGLQVALPVAWNISPQRRLVLAPEWRMERGARLLVDASLPWAELGAAGGWDTQEQAWRGALGGQALERSPRWRGGAEGLLISDAAYLSHFPDDYLTRSAPWTQTRAQLGWGPLSLAWRGWQDEDARLQGVPSLVLSHGQQLQAWRVEGAARADLLAMEPRVELAGRVSGVQALGPLELSPALEGRGWSAKGLGADGRGELALGLPMWAQRGAWRHELVPGAAGGYGAGWGEGLPWVQALGISVDDPLGVAWAGVPLGAAPGLGLSPDGWWAGPSITSNWWASRKSVRLEMRGYVGEAGLAGAGSGALRLGDWELSAAGALREDAHVLTPRLRWDGDLAQLSLAWRSASGLQDVEQGVGSLGLKLAGPRGAWRPGVDAVVRPDALAAWGAQLGWTALGDCLSVGARLGFAEDREGPQVSAWLRLTPQRAVAPLPLPPIPGTLSLPAP